MTLILQEKTSKSITVQTISNVFSENKMTDFDHVIAQIEDIFRQLINQLIARKDKLLEEVLQIREDFNKKEVTHAKSLDNLEKAHLQIQELAHKENYDRSIHEKAGLMYQQAKQEFVPTTHPDLSFHYPTLSRLRSQIFQFGEVQSNPAQDQKNIFIHERYLVQDSEKITNGTRTFPKFNASHSQLTKQKRYSIQNRSRGIARCLSLKNLFSKSTHLIPGESLSQSNVDLYRRSSIDFDQKSALSHLDLRLV